MTRFSGSDELLDASAVVAIRNSFSGALGEGR